jgi:hypothetical protein
MKACLTTTAARKEKVKTSQGFKVLKARYLEHFAVQASHVTTWRQVVCALTDNKKSERGSILSPVFNTTILTTDGGRATFAQVNP